MIAVLLLVPNPPKTADEKSAAAAVSYKGLLKNPIVILLFISIFCINIPAYGLLAWLPKFLVQQRGMPIGTSSLVVAAGGLGIWISSLGSGWLVGRYLQGREPLFVCCSSLLSALCIWLVFISQSALVSSVFLFVGYIFLMGSFVTVFTLPMKRLQTDVIGAGMGMINTGGTLGGFIAPIAIGYLVTISGNYMTTFIFLAMAMVVSGLIVLPLAGKSRHQLSPEGI